MSFPAEVSLWACLGLALLAAIWDARSRKIPNWLNLLIAIAALTFAVLSGGWATAGSAAIHAVIALVLGAGLFAIGFIGAGDAKMYSATAFALPLPSALPMLGWTSLAGFILLVGMLATRWMAGKPLRQDGKSFTVPYGVAIAGGLWLTQLS
ncbi:A24 family peptidase [Aurantiacibacter gilvus]|uniref:Prepilin peptidase n=1 Tax=Aurantiacibacter gilvus TaxID=3139141 RepID=A0ABU9IF10_9SPHN